MQINPDPFLGGYLECALWTTDYDDATIFDFDPDTLTEAQRDCDMFQFENAEALDRYYEKTARTEYSAGHDLWLTRNGHGAGFWDRIAGDGFPELCAYARAMGERCVFAHEPEPEAMYGIE